MVLHGSAAEAETERLVLAQSLENPPVVLYAGRTPGYVATPIGEPLTAGLPHGVHLLHVSERIGAPCGGDEAPRGVEVAVRLQHIAPRGANATVDLARMFAGVTLDTCTETTLTLQQPRDENKRMVWRARGDGPGADEGGKGTAIGRRAASRRARGSEDDGDCSAVRLSPLQIRTFVLASAV